MGNGSLGGHTSATVGLEFSKDSNFFGERRWGGVGWGPFFSCRLYLHIWLGGLAPLPSDLHRASATGTRWRLPSPHPLCPLPTIPPSPVYNKSLHFCQHFVSVGSTVRTFFSNQDCFSCGHSVIIGMVILCVTTRLYRTA